MCDPEDSDAKFEFCDECKCEHNNRGETREERQMRLDNGGNPSSSRLEQMQQVLDELRHRLNNGPDSDPTFNTNYIMEAVTGSPNEKVRGAQIAITQLTSSGPILRVADTGQTIEPALGDMIAALIRTAADAALSTNDGLERLDSIKATFNAVLDDCAAFYREHRPLMEQKVAAQKKAAAALVTSLELALAVHKAEDDRLKAEAIKSGKAEAHAALEASLIAASPKRDEEKEREMAILLKAFEGKNKVTH
jgi:hypothetical protein